MRTFAVVMALVFGAGCGAFDPKKTEDQDPSTSKGEEDAPPDGGEPSGSPLPAPSPVTPDDDDDSIPQDRPPCVAPEGVDNSPETMEEAVRLINALPFPVTISCYLEALARPLRVNATSSQLSVQPAQGTENPRIFLFSGKLLTTFVAVGVGSTSIEFSHLIDDTMSVKGEIAIPVKEALPLDAAYTHIHVDDRSTRCIGCHGDEEVAGAPYPPGAFKSRAFRPSPSSNIDLTRLKSVAEQCGDDSERCRIYRALFKDDDVEPASFPSGMQTFF